MNDTAPARPSGSDLRRKLVVAPSGDAPVIPAVEETQALPPSWVARRAGGSQPGLAGLAPPAAAPLLDPPAVEPRRTPLPGSSPKPGIFAERAAGTHLATGGAATHLASGQAAGGHAPAGYMTDETQQLRAENAELHRLLDEMRQLIEEASVQELRVAEMEKRHQAELQTKDEAVKELEEKITNLQEHIEKLPKMPPKNAEELVAWNDELEREATQLAKQRKRIEEDRKQLREDETSLEEQMRNMEISMARDRALLARQEVELRRLSAEINQELERMQRGDGALHEQLAKFQRRHQEVLMRSPPGSSTSGGFPAVQPPPPPDSGASGVLGRGRKPQ